MQSLPAAVPHAITPAPVDLVAAFASIPDPRRSRGRRCPLAAMLALAVVARLSNPLSILAIAQWGKRQSPAVRAALGFPDRVTPRQTTRQRLFRQRDPLPLAPALTACFAPSRSPDSDPRGSVGSAFDGKAQRGRLACADQPEYPVHMRRALLHDCGIVLARLPLDHTGEKAEAEQTAAPPLIARLGWTGGVLTGDALYCHADVCATVIDADGDYRIIVKENQATLLHAIATLFAARADAALTAASFPTWDRREATTVDKGHGRIEVRPAVEVIPVMLDSERVLADQVACEGFDDGGGGFEKAPGTGFA